VQIGTGMQVVVLQGGVAHCIAHEGIICVPVMRIFLIVFEEPFLIDTFTLIGSP